MNITIEKLQSELDKHSELGLVLYAQYREKKDQLEKDLQPFTDRWLKNQDQINRLTNTIEIIKSYESTDSERIETGK